MLSKTHSLEWLGAYCRPAAAVIVLVMAFVSYPLSAKPVVPVLTSDTQLATAGYYQLSWQLGMSGAPHKIHHFVLQQADNSGFRQASVIYRGTDQASVISGMHTGKYYYRVRVSEESKQVMPWSEPVVVEVKHHSLNKALGFFITGAVVFFMTLMFIVMRSTRVQQD